MQLTPQEIVQELNKHIVGQLDAKKAVAIALRNRYRRMKVREDIKAEITPKNILMIGPTGVGKTEIARRLAKLTNAPFVKVEATKFTEVGYVGRDVDSIIRDLAEIAIKMYKNQAIDSIQDKAYDIAEEKILDILIPQASSESLDSQEKQEQLDSKTRQLFRKRLREKELDDKEIEIDVKEASIGMEIIAPPGMEDMTNQISDMFSKIRPNKIKKRKMPIKTALKLIQEEESLKLINEDSIRQKSLEQVEQNGIVFIDEIDKVTTRQNRGGDVSREGVQRDLLPLIEGSSVNTKLGVVKTDHILFITSGAFHLSTPSDLIPELQGRLPIRVELKALKPEDFERILKEPQSSLLIQYQELLKTENINLNLTEDAIKELAHLAFHVNEKTENIGARRLHTLLEKLLEDVSFNATEYENKTFEINKKYVNDCLKSLTINEDLSRYIL